MMYETETSLAEGKILTGRYFIDDRPSYQQEKIARGSMPKDPLAYRYTDEKYSWERSFDYVQKRHT